MTAQKPEIPPNAPEPPRFPPEFMEKEARYNKWGKEHPNLIYPASPDSIEGGFLRPPGGRPGSGPQSPEPLTNRNPVGRPPMPPPGMADTMQDMLKGMRESWEDIEPYYDQAEPAPFKPKPGLWEELSEFVRQNWDDVRIGFTELPQQMIFRGRHILFRYALVTSQEMRKDKIDLAPDFQAGQEVMRVYASLGLVVNKIARWLRGKGIRCQSNHPMGGLVNTSSLAGKAGMGWQGRHGMLVTPEYGPRVRLAPVFIEYKYFEFTDNRDNDWIEEYCVMCGRCAKHCPSMAINDKKEVNIGSVPGIGAIRTCIDRNKCLETFSKTMGCSVCIKVCPFSKGDDIYERLKVISET